MAKIDLTQYGITGSTVIAHNPSFEYLFEEETKAGLEGFDKGVLTELDAVNVMTGYDFKSGITPEGGLRYMRVDQESYNDGAQRISTDTADILTAVAGVKYTTDVKAKGWTFKPTLRLAAIYDVKSDNSKANVNIIGGSGYQITGDRLHRFGVETGVGVGSTIKDWDLTLEYNGGFRKDFQSHTGMLKAKYNF